MILKLKYYFNKKIRMARDIRMIAEIAEDRGFYHESRVMLQLIKHLEKCGYNEVYKEDN